MLQVNEQDKTSKTCTTRQMKYEYTTILHAYILINDLTFQTLVSIQICKSVFSVLKITILKGERSLKMHVYLVQKTTKK